MTIAPPVAARLILVTGVVQGVGFRPFVHRLATHHALAGWVRNVAGTVEIHIEGESGGLDAFQRELRTEAPLVAQMDIIEAMPAVPSGAREFQIVASTDANGNRPVTPDLAICAECESELFDATNRRHEHPFITCTHCGPRYSIIRAVPYDRERTSMATFDMCSRCAGEYRDAADRRHHAETVACPGCGPGVWLCDNDGNERAKGSNAIHEAAARLRTGGIVAIRGIGGFHLACDATDDAAVARLRDRKRREAKPFAVMVRTIADARLIAHVSEEEGHVLSGPERPIVLVRRIARTVLAPSVSPALDRIGVMLAYTPLHHLLLAAAGRPLVMTSGNASDEPIAIDNADALARLRHIADLFVFHDREILSCADDSVARVIDGAPLLIRRARGYAPRAVRLPIASPRPLLAVGPHLKNTFTLVHDDTALTSPHIGDLDGLEALAHFKSTLARYEDLFRISPEVVVRDLHPGYLSTRIAEELGLSRTIVVQHHHAHIAAVVAEHGVTDRVVGVALDGTGFGDDGHIWGAETLLADLRGYRRVGRLRYAPLPGGDRAAREPWRAALGYLSLEPWNSGAFGMAFRDVPPRHRDVADQQIVKRVNAPYASSMGRLFDAAAAILGVRSYCSYEGQAAMELESLAGSAAAEPLPFPEQEVDGCLVLDPIPLLAALGEHRQRGGDAAHLAARFHESVVDAVVRVALAAADGWGVGVVALGGGSFQNTRLLSTVRQRLSARGLRVLIPRQLSPGDGAISLGQAAVGASILVS